MKNQPEVEELEKAVETFADQLQGMRASNAYNDAQASDLLVPLCKAIVNLFKIAATDEEIVDILTMTGKGIIDPITARVIVEYSWRAERDRVPIGKEFAEWMRLQGRAERAAWHTRKRAERPVIEAEQAGVIDRLIRVLNTPDRS